MGASPAGAGMASFLSSPAANSPQSTMTTSSTGLSACVGTFSISFTTSMPEMNQIRQAAWEKGGRWRRGGAAFMSFHIYPRTVRRTLDCACERQHYKHGVNRRG